MAARTTNTRKARQTQAPTFDFDGSLLTGLTDGDQEMFESERFEAVAYSDIARDRWDLGVGSTIDGCRITGLNLSAWSLRGSRIVESVIGGADVPVVSAARGGLRDVEFLDSRFGSIEAYDANWRGIRFTRCKLGFVNLRGSELLDIEFVDCTIDEIDLLDATARRVSFESSRIGALNASGATLSDVDLRGAEVLEVVGMAGLRGATISPEQLHLMAPALAQMAGIRVED
ncbi:pentapeptide repeat-containing protein [Microbacterium allomyrinae]|jgi:uncharacterized protein YjbI with pentapeptide repeats|uniref:Pentapeptide repeat-containing protein n=1 Tax=Microbacterium allomyrinae TaxID=2830666 RepID=A0A9X1S1H0_9MICO|nr:pentapeptide repeat-containing protein [Microbacterium allomyrinae]MCC2031676.1 pentapeptide repeat-containing protein [Microbacterium allomyrinae]